MRVSEDILLSIRRDQTHYSRYDEVDSNGKSYYYILSFCKVCYERVKDCRCTYDMLWVHGRGRDGIVQE